MRTITVELNNPITYAPGNGEEVEGSFITIKEPTGKIAHLVGIMKAEIGAATKHSLSNLSESLSEILEAEQAKQSDKKPGEEDKEDPSEAGASGYQMLIMGGANMERVMVTMKEILRYSADIGGEKAFTSAMFDKLTFNDVEKLIKEYIGNFIAA